MAISECDEHIEVRIKRPPADSLTTYFEEYFDPNFLAGPDNKVCESYIIAGEHDAQYLLEIILKPGFIRYGANNVRVEVWLGNVPSRSYHMALPPIGKGGLQDEQILHVERWTVIQDGVEIRKKLAFSRLETAPGLENETTVLGLDPTSLGTIRIEVKRSIATLMEPLPSVSKSSMHRRSRARKKLLSETSGVSPADTQKTLMVDEKLGKPENGGITHSTKFLDEGSKRRRTRPGKSWSKDAKPPQDKVGVVKFVFKYRTQGVLEALGIVKRPPPLWERAWEDLNILDRPKAFKRLQKDNKMYEMKEWEMKIRTGIENQEPPEWKAYSKIHDRDKKRLFEVLQEKNKAYTRRDGRRDVKVQVKQLEYEQGPEGWKKHGDTLAISAKKQEQSADVRTHSDGSGLSGPRNSPGHDGAQTVTDSPNADPFSAASTEVVVKQEPSNLDQVANVQGHEEFSERSQSIKDEPKVKAEVVEANSLNEILPQGPNTAQTEVDVTRKRANASQEVTVQDTKKLGKPSEPIKHEPNIKSEAVVKSEPSTATTISEIPDEGPPPKRRKISKALTQSTKLGPRSKLFSTTIDITGDVPVVEPKAAITIDLTAKSSSLVKTERPDNSSIIIHAGQSQSETSRATRTVDRSTNAKSEPSHSIDDHGTVLGPVKPEPTNPSDITVDGLEQPGFSSVERVRPTPTEAAERGECSIQ